MPLVRSFVITVALGLGTSAPAEAARLAVTVSGAGSVTETLPGVIDCTSPLTTPTGSVGATPDRPVCSGEYGAAATVALTATPPAGWSFGGWTGGPCDGLVTVACVVPIALADVAVSARFVDTTAPETTINSAPGAVSGAAVTFAFAANEPGSSFQCRLDGSPSVPCDSGATAYSGLASGSHTFEVWATDPSGNTDGTPSVHAWSVDAVAPETTLGLSSRARFALANAISVPFSADEASSFECSLDGAAWEPCASPRAYTALAARTHVFRVRATDTAGNTDASPATHVWTVPLDDRALAAGGRWARGTGSGYYLGTCSTSSTKGAKLTRWVSGARRLALVATRCPRCGTVNVYLGSKLLKQVSLRATTTRRKQLISVASFLVAQSGTLKLVVATAGKPVAIDGVGIATS